MSKINSGTVLILARGINQNGTLSLNSRIRAETAREYWWGNWREIGRIIASGMYSSSMKTPPANGATESSGIANELLRKVSGKIRMPDWLVVREDRSQTTAQGIIEAARMAQEKSWVIDPENPLLIVCSWDQFRRARPIARQAFGVSRKSIQNIRSPEESSQLTAAFELGAAVLTQLALIDAQPGNLEHTARAEHRVEMCTSWIRGLPGFTGE